MSAIFRVTTAVLVVLLTSNATAADIDFPTEECEECVGCEGCISDPADPDLCPPGCADKCIDCTGAPCAGCLEDNSMGESCEGCLIDRDDPVLCPGDCPDLCPQICAGSSCIGCEIDPLDPDLCPPDCPDKCKQPDPSPSSCPHLGIVMNTAQADDVIIIQGDGPYTIPRTASWRQPITVRPIDDTVNPIIQSIWTEFLQPLGPNPDADPPIPGSMGTKFGDNDFGTITLDARGNRDGPGETHRCRPGPMWNLIALKHGPGDPIVFENVHMINPGCRENFETNLCYPVATFFPQVRAIITQHSDDVALGFPLLSGDSGASWALDNCTIDFRTFGACNEPATDNIILDQDSASIKLSDCELLADQLSGQVHPMIRLDGRQEDPPHGILPMNLDIDNCRIEGFNAVVEFMQGDITSTIDNSCLRSLGGLQNAVLSAKGNPNLDGADIRVNDSVLVTEGNFPAVRIVGQDPRTLTMDHCDVYATNGNGIEIVGSVEPGATRTINVTNSNVSSLMSDGFIAADFVVGSTLNADFNNVFAPAGTNYDAFWTVTNDVGAGDPNYVDILDCDATYLNGALKTADSTGGPLGSAGPGIIPESLQIPGDCNQDGELDLSDVICLLGHLFQGNPESLPCSTDAANLGLMDCNQDGGIDLSDAIYKLAFLFQGGSGPVAGSACISISNCPENPGCP